MSDPKGIKGTRRRLRDVTRAATEATMRAMNAASVRIDRLEAENKAFRNILTSERAQVIYYTDKYQECLERKCFDTVPIDFLRLSEEQQMPYVKRAIMELSDSNTTDGPILAKGILH